MKKKKRKIKTKNGFYEYGDIAVDSGQIAICDPCNSDNPDVVISTNYGDGLYPVLEHYENNERVGLYIPLETEIHKGLKDILK
jgi:hypothetical protein|tara:strand:- start:1385 stop:1633 length:249 start_codon:yes stop_codon:yes gene_type:complete